MNYPFPSVDKITSIINTIIVVVAIIVYRRWRQVDVHDHLHM